MTMTFTHSFGSTTFEVVRRGTAGPAVVLMHEVTGMTQSCIEFAERIADRGYSVYLPLFFGEVGARFGTLGALRFLCCRKEILQLALCVESDSEGPVSTWLRSLALRLRHEHAPYDAIGAIGMCLTGRFVLSMMLDDSVLAGVMCQPATPMPLGEMRKRASGVCAVELKRLRRSLVARDADVIGVRFGNDRLSPPERFETLQTELDGRFGEISLLLDAETQPPAFAHSVFTRRYDASTRTAIDSAFGEVVAFLDRKLKVQESRS